ncbi:MAG: hypothetical protein CME59_10400 [Halioglobus sp.]|nr:hypothetical protein [Halioglobus sp.]|tara:strand:- start:468 stop:773 length:306 start_codon:yes stop_codon:yes gene_type:complete
MKALLATALVLALLPQVAAARVYMCVDHATGRASFTDKGCATDGSREEVRVGATNLDSGANTRKQSEDKTWRSEQDQRKSGADFAAERRSRYQREAAIAER